MLARTQTAPASPAPIYFGNKTDLAEYGIWEAIVQRCTNPNNRGFKNYGGRGIGLCAEWRQSFDSFLNSVGLRPGDDYSIDRIDNDQGYEPGNVRWATREQQSRNRQNTRLVTAFGETKCITDWSKAKGIPLVTLMLRLDRGEAPEAALSKPPTGRGYGRRKISDAQISTIKLKTAQGVSRAELSRSLNLPYDIVWRVATGAAYRNHEETI